jgi:hypothetical protein
MTEREPRVVVSSTAQGMAAPQPGPSHSRAIEGDRRIKLWLGCLVAAVLLLFSSGAITGSDGPAMYQVTRSLVEHGDLTVPPQLGFPGRGGHFYATHGLGLPLVSIIPYVLVRPIADATAHPQEISEAAVASIMPIIGALLAAALYALSRRLRGGIGSSLLVGVGGVAGTFMLVYLKDFYSEPLAALFVVVAIERLLAGRPMTGGIAAAGAALTRPQLFALAPVLVWRAWSDAGRRAALKVAVPIAGAAALAIAYNVARFGDAFQFDPLQGAIRFPGGLGDGISGLLLHPRKSIILFAPVVVLLPFALRELWSWNRTAAWLIGGNLVVVFLITAAWAAWDGGWSWGPRLLLPGVVPALPALAPWLNGSGRVRRVAVRALFAIGLLISSPAILVSSRAQLLNHPPERGPDVIRQYELVPETVTFTVRHLQSEGVRSERFVDLWQIRATRVGGGGGAAAAVAVSLGLVGLGAVAAVRLRRSVSASADADQAAAVSRTTPSPP